MRYTNYFFVGGGYGCGEEMAINFYLYFFSCGAHLSGLKIVSLVVQAPKNWIPNHLNVYNHRASFLSLKLNQGMLSSLQSGTPFWDV